MDYKCLMRYRFFLFAIGLECLLGYVLVFGGGLKLEASKSRFELKSLVKCPHLRLSSSECLKFNGFSPQKDTHLVISNRLKFNHNSFTSYSYDPNFLLSPEYLLAVDKIQSLNGLTNEDQVLLQEQSALDCKKIKWVTWSKKSDYEYKGSAGFQSVSLQMDPKTGLQNPILNSLTLASNTFTPKQINGIPTPWMPGNLNTSILKHRLQIDNVGKPEELILLLGSFPNANFFTVKRPGKLKVFDINNIQLNVSNVVILLQDPIQGNILAPTTITNSGMEILFEVLQPGTTHGDIILLSNFPKNSYYFEIEHYNELSRSDDGIFIHLGFPDCCTSTFNRIDTTACDKLFINGKEFSSSGSYFDTISLGNCDSVVNYVIKIIEKPKISLGPDTSFCEGDTLVLNSGSNVSVWSDGTIGNSILVSKAGIYWAEIVNSCGKFRDTITISILPKLKLDLGPDIHLCPNETDTIWSNSPKTIWHDGSTGSYYVANKEGAIIAKIIGPCDVLIDTIFVSVSSKPEIMLPKDTFLCDGRAIILNSPYDSTVWSDGTYGREIVITKPGIYWASYSSLCGVISDSILVSAISCLDSCTIQCNNIEWMSWTSKSTFEYIGNSSKGFVTLETDPNMGNIHPFFTNYTLSNAGFTPKLLMSIPTPWMPGNISIPHLTHKITLDGNYVRKDVMLLLGEFPNSKLYSKPQYGRLRIYDRSGRLLDVANICILFKDNGLLHEEINVAYGDREMLFYVGSSGVSDGGIIVLGNFPDSTYTMQIEHNNERSSIDDGILINLGFPDCCKNVYSIIDTTVCENITIGGKAYNVSGSYLDSIRLGNCYNITQFDVTVLSLPQLSLGPDTTICEGETLVLRSMETSTKWSDGSSGKELNIDKPGIYWAEINSPCGIVRDTIVISFLNLPTLEIGPDIKLCPNQVDTIWTNEPSTVWQDGSVGPYFVIRTDGVVRAVLKGVCGDVTDSILVNYYPNSTIDLGPDTTICQGSTIILHSNSANTVWFDNSIGNTKQVSKGGNYWASILSPCGITSDSIKVEELNLYNKPYLPNDTFLCQGFKINLSWPGIDELWNGEFLNSITIDTPGIYWYAFKDICNDLRDTMEVFYDSIPIQFPGENLVFCGPQSFYFSTGNPKTLWSDGRVGSEINIETSGIYYYLIENSCGIFRDSIHLEFIEDNSLFIPNVFSPNGDQVNDVFPGLQFTNDFEVEIYDRWGSQIFKSKNIHWDGTCDNKLVLPGVYAYIIRSKACDKQLKYGTVTLLR
jgi:gliding motility-associated-like protein